MPRFTHCIWKVLVWNSWSLEIFCFFSDPGIRIMIMMGWCCRRDIEMMWSWSSVFDSQSGGTDGRGISTFFSGFLRAIWIFLRAIWMTCHKLISLDKSTSSSPAERRRRRGESRSENQHEHWKRQISDSFNSNGIRNFQAQDTFSGQMLLRFCCISTLQFTDEDMLEHFLTKIESQRLDKHCQRHNGPRVLPF